MKKLVSIIATILVLGGLIMLGQSRRKQISSTLPSNRTQEQYDLEQEFQPLFDFLEAKDKDWEKVKYYKAGIYQFSSGTGPWQVIELNRTSNVELKGKYQYGVTQENQSFVKQMATATNYMISFNHSKINFLSNKPSTPYNQEILSFQLSKDTIKDFQIDKYMLKHPESEMKSITYIVTSDKLKTQVKSLFPNQIRQLNKGNLILTKYSGLDYSITLSMSDEITSENLSIRIRLYGK